MLALAVFIYRYTARQDGQELRLWQYAKLVSGLGFILGWLRPQLPSDWAAWAHVGNVMQVVGISMEMVVFALFLGAHRCAKWLKRIMPWVALVFVAVILIPASRHPMIVFGSAVAGALYMAMAVLNFSQARRHHIGRASLSGG